MTAKKIIYLVLISILLVSCGPKSTPTSTSTAVPTSMPTNTQAPKPTATRTLAPTQEQASVPTSTLNTQPTRTQAPRATSTTAPKPTAVPQPYPGLGPIAAVYDGSDHEITVLNLDGSTKQTLFSDYGSSTDIDYHLSWSPDGQYIAFNKTNYDDIYILSVDSKTAVNITQTDDAFEIDPTWSPNGQWIVFTYLAKDKNTQEVGVIRPDGTGKNILVECETFCNNPSWSPDSQYIAFSKKDQIYIMRDDGSELKALTHNAVNQAPAWSPDGKTIAFIRSLSYYDSRYLYLMNADGTWLRALTGEGSDVSNYVSWSPDSKYIAMRYAPKDGGMGLYIVNIQTGEIKNLAGGNYFAPAWYPILMPVEPTEEAPVALEDCTNGWTRLTAGGQAKVMGAPTDPPNRVRSEPVRAENVIGEVYAGTILKVLEGPVCASGLVFWKVESDSITGWTAEGDGTEYYLEPYVP